MILFELPLNYRIIGDPMRTTPTEVGDNNYDTDASITSATLNIDSVGDGSGDTRRFTHVFVKFVDTPVSFTVGQVFPTPMATITDPFGNILPINTDGFHNVLVELTNPQTARTVTITFASSVRVAEIILLNAVLDLSGRVYDRCISYEVDELQSGDIFQDIGKNNGYLPPINNTRDKIISNNSITFYDNRTGHTEDFRKFQEFRRKYRGGFTIAIDRYFYPHLVLPVMFQGNVSTRYRAGRKTAGRRVSFTTVER